MSTSLERRESTARAVDAMRRMGVARRRRGRLPRQAKLVSIEREYAAMIETLIELVEELLDDAVRQFPELLRSARAERVDDYLRTLRARLDVGEGSRVRELFSKARDQLRGRLVIGSLEDAVQTIAGRTARFSREQLMRQIRAGLGVEVLIKDSKLRALAEGFVAENVSLVTSVPSRLLERLEGTVLRAVQSGSTVQDLTAQIERDYEVTRGRARLIARDQVGKLSGRLNAERQKELGVDRFIWRTVNDERVRSSHADRDGKTYPYEDPPDGELPGEPIGCRCYAEPILSDIVSATRGRRS